MRIQVIIERLTAAMKNYFEAHDLTQREYAKKIGMDESTLSHYVTGRREMSYSILCQISSDMNLDLNYIFKQSKETIYLSEDQKEIVKLLNELSDERQKEVCDAMKVLMKQHE